MSIERITRLTLEEKIEQLEEILAEVCCDIAMTKDDADDAYKYLEMYNALRIAKSDSIRIIRR